MLTAILVSITLVFVLTLFGFMLLLGALLSIRQKHTEALDRVDMQLDKIDAEVTYIANKFLFKAEAQDDYPSVNCLADRMHK